MRRGIILLAFLGAAVSFCGCAAEQTEKESCAGVVTEAVDGLATEGADGQTEGAIGQTEGDPGRTEGADGQPESADAQTEGADRQKEAADITVHDQLALLAGQVEQWTAMDSEDEPYCSYAVTDLDQNGRLELIASSGMQGSGRFTTSEYFQVNRAGDGLEKLSTFYGEGSQDDIVSNIETAYYEESSEQYHYITGDFVTAGTATGFTDFVSSLTLDGDKITSETLGYRERKAVKGDTFQNSYYKMTKKGKKKRLSKCEYDEEEMADQWFSDCAKLSVELCWFQFDRSSGKQDQQKLTEQLEQSYDFFCLGIPVKVEKQKLLGYSVEVPALIHMDDSAKQERLNRFIRKRIKKTLGYFCQDEDMPFSLWSFHSTVKYAGREEMSILWEISGYAEGAPHPWSGAYTLNLNLEQERELSQRELLPGEYRKAVEKQIINKECRDVSEFAAAYRRAARERYGRGKLINAGEWKSRRVYRGSNPDTVGIVFLTSYAMGNYVIYEVDSSCYEE